MTLQEAQARLKLPIDSLVDSTKVRSYTGGFRFDHDAGLLTALSRALAAVTADEGGTLLVIRNTGVWPSTENMHLAEIFRRHLGESRSIFEAPAHLFEPADHADSSTMLQLCLFNLWDFQLVSIDGRLGVEGSHDEIIDISASTQSEFSRLERVVEFFGLQKLGGKESSENLSVAALQEKIEELRTLLGEHPDRSSTLIELANALLGGIPGPNGDRLLVELQYLLDKYPTETALFGVFAKGLSRALFYSAEEGEWIRHGQLMEVLRALAGSNPSDGIVLESFGRSLYHAIVSAKKLRESSLVETQRRELRELALSHPENPALQQWSKNAQEVPHEQTH